MVKFSKQFEAQIIPEWRDAYVDYRQLKKDLKKIHTENCNGNNSSTMEEGNTSSATIIASSLKKIFQIGHKHKHHGPIQVHRKLASSTRNEDTYKTELLEQFADVEAAKEFFGLLDFQLNKVNLFYKAKEKEFLEWRESLHKQMEILIELKTALNEKRWKGDQSNESIRDDPSISCHISYEIDEEEGQASNTDESSREDAIGRSRIRRDERGGSNRLLGRVFHWQGRNIRLNIPLSTPSHTFTAISYLVWEGIVNPSSNRDNQGEIRFHVNKTNLQEAENMIRGSFIELYKGLSYLKSYRSLNMLGIVRILKKFDKVTSKEVMPIYLRVVDSSYFNISDKVTRLADEVKALFVKQFGEDDHRKAMTYLKPAQSKESHGITFFIGFFTGCFLALLVGYVIMAHIIGMYKQRSDTAYMETVYPVLSMFSLLFLHLFLYGCNILMWKKARINYSFIFELTPTKELKYKEVFLICTALMSAVLGVLFLHLTLVAKGYASTKVQTIPGILLLFFLILLVCPFNIVYKASRYRFLCVIRNIAFSPLYKVDMLDFFMADQLCSQVPLLRNLEYIACYYISGSYRTQDYNYCTKNTLYRDLAYAVSFLPYHWRAMQCARRWLDEGQTNHLVNLGKYVSAMLAAGAKLAYEKREGSVGYLCLVVALSSVATVYQLYWDYVQDWGLLKLDSRNLWLRDELMVKRKSIYYFSMVLNLVLRLAWIQTVLHTSFGSVDYRVIGLLLAALEVIRRGQWNFYRLENEQRSNAGKFRAVKTVPLPFSEVGEGD